MAALNLRTSARTSISRMLLAVNADNYAPDKVEIDQSLRNIEAHFIRIVTNHMILVGEAEADVIAAHDQLYAETEATYDQVCIKLRRLLSDDKPERDYTSNNGRAVDMRLDPVSIPIFDGRPENWLMFKDMFQTLVHNRTDLEPPYKLSKLRQYVKSAEVPMVAGVYTGGYEQVWSELKRRYDNPRRLVETHVNRLLDLPDSAPDQQRALQDIIDCTRSTLRALSVLNLPTDKWDAIIYPILLRKLPKAASSQWTMGLSDEALPKLDDMLAYFERRALNMPSMTRTDVQQNIGRRPFQRGIHTNVAATNPPQHSASNRAPPAAPVCPRCSGPHRIYRCKIFRNMSITQRWEAVKSLMLCFNCLNPHHTQAECSSGMCALCRQKHNTLLCKATTRELMVTHNHLRHYFELEVNRRLSFIIHANSVVLLATATALILDRHGNRHLCRILCDPGSQVSFITESAFNNLNLHRNRCEVAIEGIGTSKNTYTRGQTTLIMRSTIEADFELQFEVYILRSITSTTLATSIDADCWKHLRPLQLANPGFAKPGPIDLLIGADIWGNIIRDGIVTGQHNEPCAIRTHLGWVVFGPAITNPTFDRPLNTFSVNKCVGEQRLDELLHKFWELEEPVTECDPAQDPCEKIFENTVRRNAEGRYSVQIPFRPDARPLGNSHQLALRQFYQLERRLHSDSELRTKYVKFMREYIVLNHMEAVVDSRSDPSQSYYIPHHAVIEKFRVVFNASAKTSNGVSLNDTQLVGPQLQDVLVNIIFRFRKRRIAITGDVEKMFRQVEVDPCHRQWQQILWRESSIEPLQTYQLKTITYGMACSPYLAIRALRQCAIDNHRIINDASRAAATCHSILHNFYVDDYLDSADSPSESVTLALDIDAILQQGKFHLRKWNSNDVQTVMAIIGSQSSAPELEISDSSTTVLGLHWNPINDQLFYKIRVRESNAIPTKRLVLSDIARLYDPTGMLAQVIVTAKIFIQVLWREKLDWDTPLADELRTHWLTFRNGLQQLAQIQVPRWLGVKPATTITLHGFCDASTKAYAAVIYMRIVDADGHTSVSLVTAKTKVAPVKEITIPRLELCAAHLLVTVINNVRTALQLEDAEYTLWSDSSIVLCWLRKPAATLKQYVSNRVSYIQQHSNVLRWQHVRTEHNPADCASRGIFPSALEGHSLWWKGPPWFYNETTYTDELPTLTSYEEDTVVNETKPFRALLSTKPRWKITTCINGGGQIPLIERFGTLQKLLHTTALILRFRPAGRKYWRTKFIAASEMEESLLLHIREAQGNAYITEINSFKSRCSIDASSKLLALDPSLDPKGILRVGGRLTHADIGYDQRHPMILPKECLLAQLLINHAHTVTLHGGIQEMLQYLRRRFWIIHGRALVKTFIHQCVICKRHQRTMQQQQMASLPRSRVLIAPPFTNTGLDYCGPFNVRVGGRRATTTTKTYVVIFICMATRAVHIEVAEDLSTRAFLDVFDRFTSRRGYCTTLYSDNGTQFVGAHRLMQRDLREWNNTHAQQHIADAGVKWKFIAPAAPHHGGLWEAAVRSAKKHLVRIIGNQPIQYHQLNTLLIRIEACLNSRPIMALHDDPGGGLALTPGKFLIGRPITTRPEPTVPEVPENRLKYWQQLQRMYQQFWRRWQQDYLTLLQTRSKWARAEPNLQIDDIVIIQHDNLPPSRWCLGRVVNVHPGSDGLVRVVTIEYNSHQKTSDGRLIKHQCQRPIQKLCRLISAHEEVPNRTGLTGQECLKSNPSTSDGFAGC